jgi:hypothetical protein
MISGRVMCPGHIPIIIWGNAGITDMRALRWLRVFLGQKKRADTAGVGEYAQEFSHEGPKVIQASDREVPGAAMLGS